MAILCAIVYDPYELLLCLFILALNVKIKNYHYEIFVEQ